MEKVAEEIEVWLDAKESFTKMNKNRNVEDGVWVLVMDLNPIVIKEAAKKIGGKS